MSCTSMVLEVGEEGASGSRIIRNAWNVMHLDGFGSAREGAASSRLIRNTWNAMRLYSFENGRIMRGRICMVLGSWSKGGRLQKQKRCIESHTCSWFLEWVVLPLLAMGINEIHKNPAASALMRLTLPASWPPCGSREEISHDYEDATWRSAQHFSVVSRKHAGDAFCGPSCHCSHKSGDCGAAPLEPFLH